MKILDLTGQRFGRLTVIERTGTATDGQKTYLCKCDCGNEKVITSGNLRSGHTTSCGCASSKITSQRNRDNAVHGGCGTRLYGIWIDMRSRCNYEKSINWHLYGGRGIKVCEEWQNDFSVFREWALENGYADGLQLDRIDNDGNYEPSNCKWSTRSEQGNNRRTCKYITIGNETKTISEWCDITGVDRMTAYSRIRRGWNAERAVTEKASPKRVLSEREVKNIRKQYKPRDKKYGTKAIARKYGVSVAAIEAIVENRNWKGVE